MWLAALEGWKDQFHRTFVYIAPAPQDRTEGFARKELLRVRRIRPFNRRWCALTLLVVVAKPVWAAPKPAQRQFPEAVFVEPGPREKGILYSDGSEVDVQTETVWRPMCGSDTSNLTMNDLQRIAQLAKDASAAHPWAGSLQGGVAGAQGGFDLVFNTTTALPPGAAEALLAVEHYLEAQFSDAVTIVINLGFASLAPIVLGETGPSFASVAWTTARDGLQADMDDSDTIQDFLPAASTLPVRYNGAGTSVVNENQVYFTKANFLAALGTVAGSAGSVTFNSNILWDYTPPEINAGAHCFQSVLAHEVGHVLGFTSGTDYRASDLEALDIYRFQRSDGNGTDHNPDNLAEFGATARMVDQNSPGTDDDVNSDLITVEYQMSDGIPYQASHFSEQNPSVYLMDPARSSQETAYPNFFRSGDFDMLDAVGWDYPPVPSSCEDARELKCNSSLRFDNSGVSNPPNPEYGCGPGAAYDGTSWHRFTADTTSARIFTCDSSAPDSAFAVYSGACGSLVEIACSEEGGCAAAGLSSLCVTGLTVGETYWVQMSARSTVDRGIYELGIECSCLGACCLPSPTNCAIFDEESCLGIAGRWAGPDTACVGDGNGDGFDDACDVDRVNFSQPPVIPGGEGVFASNVDGADFEPNVVLADDFTSDGRAIRSVRWWGSELSPPTILDGWFISFHEPLALAPTAGPSLGVYFCPAEVVTAAETPLAVCGPPHAVWEYGVTLLDCCLVDAHPDSRSTLIPAQATGFMEELCFDYEFGVQAVAGVRYDKDQSSGDCNEILSGNTQSGDFWGWHSTAKAHGDHAAYSSAVSMAENDLLYGPWNAVSPTCASINMAFEFITTTPDGTDCNCNGVDDVQDIAKLTSSDCNANTVPDECEPDCNGSGAPDDCDIAQETSQDCQTNGVPDDCDLFFGGAVDTDGNSIPDECCEPVDAPQAGPEAELKNRFITLQESHPDKLIALRVTLTSLQHPNPPNDLIHPPRDFSAYQGGYRWVGPPVEFPEGHDPQPSFRAARLQCTPYYTDWASVGLVHVYGPEIMPSSIYSVQAIEQDCDINGEESEYSAPLILSTARWGDVAPPFNPPSTQNQPDGIDVVGLVSKFKSVAGAPTKVYSALQPAIVNLAGEISALDILSGVDAFRGFAYPYTGIVACPP